MLAVQLTSVGVESVCVMSFRSPGPIQFAGAPAAHLANLTLALEINGGKPISIF